MNISDEHVVEIKSQRQKELEELRQKGLAKDKRNKLKDCELISIINLCCFVADIAVSSHLFILFP